MWNCRCWIVLLLVAYSCTETSQTFSNLYDWVTNAFTGVEGFIHDTLHDIGKQLLIGYPLNLLANAIDIKCSALLSSASVLLSHITRNMDQIKFQLRTACGKHAYPLLKAEDMWKSPEFNPNKKVVIVVTGWHTTINNNNLIDVLAKAYNCRGDVNFVAVDTSTLLTEFYKWSSINTNQIGRHIAEGLVHLTAVVPVENIHLIGHSLGAHIMGVAGRHFNVLTRHTIPRITGLDPAKPCFNQGGLYGLTRGDAKFIDVIHTNPGVLGKSEALGDVDFYPGGLDPLSPGCLSLSCSHSRAWQYYAESVYPGNEHNFLGKRCNSLTMLRAGQCPGEDYPMGYATPHDPKGTFFLEVRDSAPFGMNVNKTKFLMNEKCGLCAN